MFGPEPMSEHEAKTDADDRGTVWGFIWVLFLFKIGTVAATIWAAGFTSEAGYILSITTWPWLIIPALALSGPLLYQYRIRRVRRRKAAMQLAEWMIEEEPTGSGRASIAAGNLKGRSDGD